MKIVGLDGITVDELNDELARGAKFVIFEYCVSLIVVTMKNPTNIYFIRAGEGTLGKAFMFSALSCVTGWWGFPFGPIYTIWAVIVNCRGGRDVTSEVINSLSES